MAGKLPIWLKRRLKSRKAIFGSLVVLMGLIGWLAVRSIQGPAVGEVYKPSQGSTIENPAYIEVDGKEVVFTYPEEYQPVTENRKEPNIIEDYTYRKSATGTRTGNLTLAISVYELASSKLEEDGAYRIRDEQPGSYVKRLSSINSRPFMIFKKSDGSETVAFTQDGKRVATIAMSGSLANNNQSEAEFTAILNSWQWK